MHHDSSCTIPMTRAAQGSRGKGNAASVWPCRPHSCRAPEARTVLDTSRLPGFVCTGVGWESVAYTCILAILCAAAPRLTGAAPAGLGPDRLSIEHSLRGLDICAAELVYGRENLGKHPGSRSHSAVQSRSSSVSPSHYQRGKGRCWRGRGCHRCCCKQVCVPDKPAGSSADTGCRAECLFGGGAQAVSAHL